MKNINILFFLLLACSLRAQTDADIIKVTGGLIKGTIHDNIHSYKGIPFAAPPVGDLRWKAPQPAASWKGVKQCDAFSASPVQGEPKPFSMWSQEFLIPKEPISEDCLYLNVWTGASSPVEKRPVLVWIYGGGFVSGGSAVPIYDGEAMAKKGVVFVSLNYRVGVFGFLALDSLSKESPYGASGNYGLLDQIAALQWIRRNIMFFGGDPNNVTIAGQSAGSMSVNCLVASPLAKGLFTKAIAESGAAFGRHYNTLAEAEKMGRKMVDSLPAKTLAELRTLPAEEVYAKTKGSYGPVVDGYVLPSSVPDIFSQHKQNKISLLTGWNEEEGLLVSPLVNASGYVQQMQKTFDKHADSLLYFYPAGNDSVAKRSQYNLSRDLIFGVPNYEWANVQSESSPVYVYRFTHKPPATGEYRQYGAFHTGEVAYALDNLRFINRPWQPADEALAKTMSSYWINFATTGNPNGKEVPQWPQYKANTKQIIVLGDDVTAETMPDASALDNLYSGMEPAE